MFGKRSGAETEFGGPELPTVGWTLSFDASRRSQHARAPSPSVASPPLAPARAPAPSPVVESRRSDSYYQVKATIFGALIEAIDLAQLAKLDVESAREEIRDIVNEIIAIKNIVMSIAEQEELLDDICNDDAWLWSA